MTTLQEAAQRRAEAAEAAGEQARSASPAGVEKRRGEPTACQMRSGGTVERDGKKYLHLAGEASAYEKRYLMYDFFGMYEEVVSEGAGATSLAMDGGPDVVYLLNHTGIPFARTGRDGKTGTLELSEPGGSLFTEAFLNPDRAPALDLYKAVDEGSITEMSFAFRITQGRWSPDYLEYRIESYDINRGDVSPVTFGANPHTSIEARAQQFALTNDLLRAARSFDASQLELVRDALSASGAATDVRTRQLLGAKAQQGLRQFRAELIQGGQLDAVARSTMCSLIDDILDGTGKLYGGDGPLDVLLGVRAAPEPVASTLTPMRLDYLERELDAARQLTLP